MSPAEAVTAAVEEAGRCGTRVPYILGVTVLTSISAAQLRQEMKVGMDLEELVVEWARMAQQCGLAGVVASPQEVPAIRQACGPEFLIVTPGVRPRGSASDDQQRVTTPAEAVRLGSDYLVIGRPIVQAPDPVAAADQIIAELEGRAC
jgi:orotidine-5'-phosphate decarboxylase